VAYSRGQARDGAVSSLQLIRLDPGAEEPATLLTAPHGITALTVAADYVDRPRPTGEPEFGFNRREAVGRSVCLLPCVVPFLLALAFVGWRARSRRRRRRAR
jgi:hypothetical protein